MNQKYINYQNNIKSKNMLMHIHKSKYQTDIGHNYVIQYRGIFVFVFLIINIT